MKKCTSFEEQKGIRYIWGNVYFDIIVFYSLSSTKLCLEFLLIFFAGEHLSDFMTKWGWFYGHDVRFPKKIDWGLKFEEVEIWFCRWKSNDYNDINIFLTLENLCIILLAKEKTWKRISKTNCELSRLCNDESLNSRVMSIIYISFSDFQIIFLETLKEIVHL